MHANMRLTYLSHYNGTKAKSQIRILGNSIY